MKPALNQLMLTTLIGALSGCSLIDPRSQPDPHAQGNVRCVLAYQPCSDPGGGDLRFIAISNPYRSENFNLSLPDGLLHAVFAPGRHLIDDAQIDGATCQTQWPRGHRLPSSIRTDGWLRCRRTGLARVRFHVQTKWGDCVAELAAGKQAAQNLHYWSFAD